MLTIEKKNVEYVMRHLTENHLLSNVQRGFVKRRSTRTNLLESLNDWKLAIRDGHSIVVGYIDFNNAFDSVSHEKLFYCFVVNYCCGWHIFSVVEHIKPELVLHYLLLLIC